jgi:hypothetical protein
MAAMEAIKQKMNTLREEAERHEAKALQLEAKLKESEGRNHAVRPDFVLCVFSFCLCRKAPRLFVSNVSALLLLLFASHMACGRWTRRSCP